MFELVLFSINIINTCTVVFDVPKVHTLRYLKILRHLSISSYTCFFKYDMTLRFVNVGLVWLIQSKGLFWKVSIYTLSSYSTNKSLLRLFKMSMQILLLIINMLLYF